MPVVTRGFRLAAATVVEMLVGLALRSRHTCALLVAPGLEGLRWRAGRLRAWRAAERARRQVPAYRRRLNARGLASGPLRLGELPETDKAGYVLPHRLEDLCRHGRLPRRGVVLDESSGSSGTPTSWVRGSAERRATAQLPRTAFVRGIDDGPAVVLNAFSLGAWATGRNVTMALATCCRIKSTGPDRDKVLRTIRELGHDYRYVVLGYPPVPRLVRPRTWRSTSRPRPTSRSPCGELQTNDALRRSLLGSAGGAPPMIFQYNPLDYVIETNAAGELVITVCRAVNLSPRIRYNIGDVGHVMRMPHRRRVLERHGATDLLRAPALDLPVLFRHRRSDATVDFYGAVVTPDGLCARSTGSLSSRGSSGRSAWWRGRTRPPPNG